MEDEASHIHTHTHRHKRERERETRLVVLSSELFPHRSAPRLLAYAPFSFLSTITLFLCLVILVRGSGSPSHDDIHLPMCLGGWLGTAHSHIATLRSATLSLSLLTLFCTNTLSSNLSDTRKNLHPPNEPCIRSSNNLFSSHFFLSLRAKNKLSFFFLFCTTHTSSLREPRRDAHSTVTVNTDEGHHRNVMTARESSSRREREREFSPLSSLFHPRCDVIAATNPPRQHVYTR